GRCRRAMRARRGRACGRRCSGRAAESRRGARGRRRDYNGPMPDAAARKSLAAARELLARPLSFDEFLAKLPAKDRLNAERRVAVLEAEPDPARAPLWRRLACALMTLAP